DVIHRIQEEKSAEYQDAVLPVLVEGFSKTDPNVLTGRTESNKTVDFTVRAADGAKAGSDPAATCSEAGNDTVAPCAEALIGQIIPVKIVKAQTFSLYGEADL
ncbi:MAG: TRAM domain-containing protein, partial [Firmicutes bacterium]|nr:TRAM domain-containing protein [Bacillota bacterium]